MTRKKIFVDFDSTIVKTIEAIVNLYNEDFQYYEHYKYVDPEQINTWSFAECECATKGQIYTYFTQPRFFDKLRFMDGAKYVLEKLEGKYRIIVVSCGTFANLKGKEIWLKDHLPFAKFIGVDSTAYKSKSHINMAGGLFIDDCSNMLNTNAQNKVCFGKAYPWNRDWQGVRCYDWTEVDEYVNECRF